MLELKPPIFLLGNVRSGTSMLHDFFDAHPDVAFWYEPRTVWCYADPRRKHDRFTADDATPKVTRYIRRRFLRYQREHGNRRVMEKTPSNLFRIPYVRAIFPESKFLYVIREPLANLSSSEIKWRDPITISHAWSRIKETPALQLHHYVARGFVDHFRRRVLRQRHVSIWGVRYPGIHEDRRSLTTEQIIAKQWVLCSRQAEEDLKDIDPSLIYRLRYDDFVTDPVPEFERILNHFDLEMTPELASLIATEVDPGRQNKWRRLDSAVLDSCLPILEKEMSRHGYDMPSDVTSGTARRSAGSS